jgi:cell wall-associated NlpC family hydrolase
MSWSNRFIGIPFRDHGRDFAGADCWGLAWLIYRDELGVTLPDYLGYASAEEQAEVSSLFRGAVASPIWSPVTTPQPFDIALFRRGRLTTHVGVVVSPGLMIHVEGEDCAKVVSYRSGAWLQRLAGHYRHVSRVLEGGVQ